MTCVLQGMAPKSCRMQFNSCLTSFQVWILCNDCGASNEVMYHIVAHKCTSCSSYNTRVTRGPLNSGSSSSSSSSEWDSSLIHPCYSSTPPPAFAAVHQQENLLCLQPSPSHFNKKNFGKPMRKRWTQFAFSQFAKQNPRHFWQEAQNAKLLV